MVGGRDRRLISGMSAGQLAVLHRLAMLRVTATLEKYSPSHRAGRSWYEPPPTLVTVLAYKFLLRDAMLARHMPSSCVCPSVRLSVTSQSSVETAEQNELLFGMGASFNIIIQ